MKSEDELDQIAKEINMTATQTNNENMSKAQEAAVDAALADLDELETITGLDELEDLDLAAEEVVEEPAEAEEAAEPVEAAAETEVSDSAVLGDGELDELELEMDKAEAYASQESATVGASADGTIQKEGTTKPRSGGGAARSSTPRAPRDMASVPAEHFVLTGDVSALSDADKDAAKTAVMGATPAQKKVAEKFENIFQSMAAGRAPSKYVMIAFGALDQNKTMSSAELIAAFKSSGQGEGTARSQTGQIMALFPVLGIAERDGKTLKLSTGSNIADYLRKHIGA